MGKSNLVENSCVAELIENSNGQSEIDCLDLCYSNESDLLNTSDIISLCVTVISYNPESYRSQQMLIILRDFTPYYVKQLMQKTNANNHDKKYINDEMAAYKIIFINIHTLLKNVDALTRPFVGHIPRDYDRKLFKNRRYFPFFRDPDAAANQVFSATMMDKQITQQQYENYARPRDILLAFLSDFLYETANRINELSASAILDKQNYNKSNYILDSKSHMKMAEIVNSLLKLVPYDISLMARYGLNSYLTKTLPAIDWSNDSLRPILNLVYKRLDKMFTKISKTVELHNCYLLDYLTIPISGIIITLKKYPFIAHLPVIKYITQSCVSLVLQFSLSSKTVLDTQNLFQLNGYSYMSAVVELSAEHMSLLRESVLLTNSMVQNLNLVSNYQQKIDPYLFFFFIPLLLYCIKYNMTMAIDDGAVWQTLSNIVIQLEMLIEQNSNQNGSDNKYKTYITNESNYMETEVGIYLWSLKVLIVYNENLLSRFNFSLYRVLRILVKHYKDVLSDTITNFEEFIYSYRPNLFLNYMYIKKSSFERKKLSQIQSQTPTKNSKYKPYITREDIIDKLVREYGLRRKDMNDSLNSIKRKRQDMTKIPIEEPNINSPINTNSDKVFQTIDPQDKQHERKESQESIGCQRYGHGRKTLRLTKKRYSTHRSSSKTDDRPSKIEMVQDTSANAFPLVSLPQPENNSTESVISETSALLGKKQ